MSKLIHDNLVDYYMATMGQAHPRHHQHQWTRSSVQAKSVVLGNAMQTGTGNDCALHTCIVAILIQEEIPLDVLADHPENASQEMRIRFTLSMARDEWFFHPGSVKNRKASKVKTVEQESSLVPKIKKLGGSLTSPNKTKNDSK
jgi:hypothetical protein